MIKNYTSTVPAERTVSEIEQLLVRNGARNVAKEYEDGEVKALAFTIMCPDTAMPLMIRLPANPQAAYKVIHAKRKRWAGNSQKKDTEQAKRTAWRLMLDWVAVQLSLVEMKQAEMLQVFLPYVWSNQRSYYEQLKERKFAALTYDPARHQAAVDDDSIAEM